MFLFLIDAESNRLTHLNLYDSCVNDTRSIEKILKSCHFLQKLALARLTTLNQQIVEYIVQNASTLTVLNLWACKGELNKFIKNNRIYTCLFLKTHSILIDDQIDAL